MERLHNLKHSARRSVVMLIAFLILVPAGSVSVGCFAGIAGSAFPSEDDSDDDSAAGDDQGLADAQDLTLVWLRTPAALDAAAPRSFRLPVRAARARPSGPLRAPSRLSTTAPPLRC